MLCVDRMTKSQQCQNLGEKTCRPGASAINPGERLHQCAVGWFLYVRLTRVKLLGDAAHLFTVVRGHSWTTSLVLSSTLITDSLVMPRSRGTSLFLLFIFSCKNKTNRNTAFKHKNIAANQYWTKVLLELQHHCWMTVTTDYTLLTSVNLQSWALVGDVSVSFVQISSVLDYRAFITLQSLKFYFTAGWDLQWMTLKSWKQSTLLKKWVAFPFHSRSLLMYVYEAFLRKTFFNRSSFPHRRESSCSQHLTPGFFQKKKAIKLFLPFRWSQLYFLFLISKYWIKLYISYLDMQWLNL